MNRLKRMEKETPNDQEFGTKVRKYLNNNRTCCDKKENHIARVVSFTQLKEDNNEIYCKVCGKFIRNI